MNVYVYLITVFFQEFKFQGVFDVLLAQKIVSNLLFETAAESTFLIFFGISFHTLAPLYEIPSIEDGILSLIGADWISVIALSCNFCKLLSLVKGDPIADYKNLR